MTAMLSSIGTVESKSRMSFVHRHRRRCASALATVVMLLMFAAAAHADVRSTSAASMPRIASTHHPLVATALATLPPEEKPKTHWPWWLRLLAVVGVLVFIRLVAGSVRNKPGTPGPR